LFLEQHKAGSIATRATTTITTNSATTTTTTRPRISDKNIPSGQTIKMLLFYEVHQRMLFCS